MLSAYSKVHFKLIRQKTSTGMHVFLEDTSSNGTFINGEKVGKGNRQVLANNDEIALALKKNKAFMYMDLSVDSEDANLPAEIKKIHTLTKSFGEGVVPTDSLHNAFIMFSISRAYISTISEPISGTSLLLQCSKQNV
ncbi:hypothetical protein ScPMuIL_007195 [Solemya velum]